MDHNPQGQGRRHFHRGRRGQDRRSPERRASQTQTPEQPARDHVDIDQVMREIRAHVAQRQGIDLNHQQIQDLAARRLESILDVRTIRPELMERFRRSAGMAVETTKTAQTEAAIFDDSTLSGSPGGFLGLMRRVLSPLLKLFFDPASLTHALKDQAALNTQLRERLAERDRRQAEWNALHFEVLQRLVSETARLSLENQDLALKVESLSAKVDFGERRVRSLEGTAQAVPRPPARDAVTAAPRVVDSTATEQATPAVVSGDAPRRRRRRRRGRRGTLGGELSADAAPGAIVQGTDAAADSESDADEADETETSFAEPPQDEAVHATSIPAEPAPPRDEPPPTEPADGAGSDPPDR